MENGARLLQFGLWGGENQRFLPELLPDRTYLLIAEHSKKVLDVGKASLAKDAPIHQWEWHGGANQRFHLDVLNLNTASEQYIAVRCWMYWGPRRTTGLR